MNIRQFIHDNDLDVLHLILKLDNYNTPLKRGS